MTSDNDDIEFALLSITLVLTVASLIGGIVFGMNHLYAMFGEIGVYFGIVGLNVTFVALTVFYRRVLQSTEEGW